MTDPKKCTFVIWGGDNNAIHNTLGVLTIFKQRHVFSATVVNKPISVLDKSVGNCDAREPYN